MRLSCVSPVVVPRSAEAVPLSTAGRWALPLRESSPPPCSLCAPSGTAVLAHALWPTAHLTGGTGPCDSNTAQENVLEIE
jgi:hypothetical protein